MVVPGVLIESSVQVVLWVGVHIVGCMRNVLPWLVVMVKIEVGKVLGKMVLVLSGACVVKDLGRKNNPESSPCCVGCCAGKQQLAAMENNSSSVY